MSSYIKTPSGDVILYLTKAEATGLLRCADEGAEGLLVPPLREVTGWFDHQSERKAAARAIDTLGQALV